MVVVGSWGSFSEVTSEAGSHQGSLCVKPWFQGQGKSPRVQNPTQLRARVSSESTATQLGPSASCLVSLLPIFPFPQPVPTPQLLCLRLCSNHTTPLAPRPSMAPYCQEIRSKPLGVIPRPRLSLPLH